MRAIVLSLVLLIPGCGMPSPSGLGPTGGSVIGAPIEDVWPQLAYVYRSLGIPITEIQDDEFRVWSSSLESIWSLVYRSEESSYVRCTLPGRPRGVAVAAAPGRGGGVMPVPAGIHPGPQELPNQLVTVTISTELRPDGDATRVMTRVSASATPTDRGEPRPEPYCVSTGRLEARIRASLENAQVAN